MFAKFSVVIVLCSFYNIILAAPSDRNNRRSFNDRFYPRLSNTWDDSNIYFETHLNSRPLRETYNNNNNNYENNLEYAYHRQRGISSNYDNQNNQIKPHFLPYSIQTSVLNNDYNDIDTLHGDGFRVKTPCKLSNGQISKCLAITECPTALRDIHRGIRHIRCGFKGTTEIVCCPDAIKQFGYNNYEQETDNTLSITFPNEWGTSWGNNRGPTKAPIPVRPTKTPVPVKPTRPTKMPTRSAEIGLKSDKACKKYNSIAIPRVGLFIQGGKEAELTEFPHMALIGYPPNGALKTQGTLNDGRTVSWRCGGSLISEKYVLTAGHCVAYLGNNIPMVVRLGELDWMNNEDGAEPQDFNIKRIVLHPEYKTPLAYHDIALLELDRPVTFDASIQPACLPSPTDQDLSRRRLLISGWGDTEFAMDRVTSMLLKAEQTTVSMNECNTTYTSDNESKRKLPRALLNVGHVCAQDKLNNADTCQGDSGGPLQEQLPSPSPLYRIVGVTSLGKSCSGKHPSLYAKVADYIGWIEDVVWP